MLYVYAITDLQALPLMAGGGIGAQPLVLHSNDGLAVVCSWHKGNVQPDGENILAHERVIEACMEIGAVLPARFGTCFESMERIDAVLEQNRQTLRGGLERVRGCVETGVRVLWPNADSDNSQASTPPPSSGKEYLLHRAAMERARIDSRTKAQRVAEEINSALVHHAVAGSMRVVSSAQLQLSGAYLVRRSEVESFQDRVRELAPIYPQLRVLGTGPWPPYHFTPTLDLQNPAEVCHA